MDSCLESDLNSIRCGKSLPCGNNAGQSTLGAAFRVQTHTYIAAVVVANETFAVALPTSNQIVHAEAVFTSRRDYPANAVASDPALAGTPRIIPQFEVAA